MHLSEDSTDSQLLKDKLSAYPDALAQRVLEFRSAPDATLASEIVVDILCYHEPDRFTALYAEKGDALALIEDLGMDSLTMTEIAFEAEDFLDITITNEDMIAMQTVADLKSYIVRAIP